MDDAGGCVMYVTRTMEIFVRSASRQFPVLLMTGARQVGKTTLLNHLRDEERQYVTLDDPLLRNLAREDPALFMQRYTPPVIIDEIQYAPQLLPYIKMAVDRERAAGGFWLTGSQAFHLMQGVSESLAGRVAVIELLGLSQREQLGQGSQAAPFLPLPEEISRRAIPGKTLDLNRLYQNIWRGSFPAAALHPDVDWQLFYSSYVQTYLMRDVHDLTQVGNEMKFVRFLRATAARTGQLLNLTDLARDADIAVNTAKSWLGILQASAVVYLLMPYHSNLTKRLIKAPKLYFLDTGLAAYLTGWTSPQTLEAGAMSGAFLETWILGELLKGYRHNGREATLFFYRDKDQVEIDFLLVQDGTIYPLECKKSASPKLVDARHFQALQRLQVPIGPGGILCLCPQPLPLSPTINAIPIGIL